MRVALTVWENRVSPVADSARQLLVADIWNRSILGRRYEPFHQESLFYRARKLVDLNAKIFICGAISDFFRGLVEGYGIQLIPFIRGKADEVLQAYLSESLSNPRFVMIGCPADQIERGRTIA
jgi:predicted Fe-Mo cluster-binding NifX family protein